LFVKTESVIFLLQYGQYTKPSARKVIQTGSLLGSPSSQKSAINSNPQEGQVILSSIQSSQPAITLRVYTPKNSKFGKPNSAINNPYLIDDVIILFITWGLSKKFRLSCDSRGNGNLKLQLYFRFPLSWE